jgi:hypothetical protein
LIQKKNSIGGCILLNIGFLALEIFKQCWPSLFLDDIIVAVSFVFSHWHFIVTVKPALTTASINK